MDIKTKVVNLLKELGIIDDDPKDQMISYEVVYEPDVKDSHGNWMTRETLEKACQDFNENLKAGIVKSNLFHLKDTESFTVVDTWIQKELDVTVNESGEQIKAGTWVSKIKYNDENLWQLKKSGVIGGVSIGARGVVNEETGEIISVSFDKPLEENNAD